MWPCSSSTNPDPPLGPNSEEATSTLTTPGPLCVNTSRTGGLVPFPEAPSAGGETSLIVTSPGSSSNPNTPTKMNSAVMSPPMIADTNAVSAVFRGSSFRAPRPLRLGWLCAEVTYVPPVYSPLAALVNEVPGPLV
jgi:hypothetical protein